MLICIPYHSKPDLHAGKGVYCQCICMFRTKGCWVGKKFIFSEFMLRIKNHQLGKNSFGPQLNKCNWAPFNLGQTHINKIKTAINQNRPSVQHLTRNRSSAVTVWHQNIFSVSAGPSQKTHTWLLLTPDPTQVSISLNHISMCDPRRDI